MKAQKAQTLIRLAIVFGILILVNVISIRVFGRIDLTAQNVYTLSEASKALVHSLDDLVTIKAYFTDDLPAPYNNNRRATLDILNEYKAYAGGNLQFEFISPAGEKAEQEAQQQGIGPVQVQVIQDDKLEVKRGYMGLLLLYEDRKETLPLVQNLGSLEYDISSALKRLTTRVKKKIGYSTGHQEADPGSFQQAAQLISGQYDLVPIDLGKNEPVPSDIAALFVISPQTRFADSSKYSLDQYLMRGGKIAFLLNRMNANLQNRFAQPLELGLDDILAQYGTRVNADLVRDAQCAPITVMQQQGFIRFQSQVPFPYLPTASNFSKTNAIVKDLQSVLFYFVSSVDTSLASQRGLSAEVLVRSSKQSGRQSGFVMLDPFQKYSPQDLAEGGIPFAAILEGSFKSFFTDKQPRAADSISPVTRVVVAGDGDFMKDEFLGSRDNVTLFANMIDYLADDAGLITIRSKNVNQPPLEPLTDGTKRMLKYGNLIFPPLLVIGYGLVRWRRRQSLRKALEAQG